MNYFVLPLWSDASFLGKPKYEILARRTNSEWIKIFLSPNEPKALIAYTMQPDIESKHWLDRLEVSFHPRCQGIAKNSEYVTVEPSGEHEVRTFSHCEP
jgi:hypothetical protein